jgi:hypothetical protein
LPKLFTLKHGETKGDLAKKIYGEDFTFDSALPQDWVDQKIAQIRADPTIRLPENCTEWDIIIGQLVWGYPKEGPGHIFGVPLAVTEEADAILTKIEPPF